MRTVLIRVEGAKRPIRKLQLCEGARVSDILQSLHVPDGSVLTRAAKPTHPLPDAADVHSLLGDGEHLVVRSLSTAVENATPFTLSFSN
jgi:hypothetical protein